MSCQELFKDIIGQSQAMRKVFSVVEMVADSDTTIMITGETGTGKGLIARAIHQCSYRKDKPLVQINCGAISEGLLESELFGHKKGAFTGAIADKAGKFELAEGGSVFLDEIGDMSPDLQVKVLRVLEEKEFERVGGSQALKADVRIIAATHRDLEEEVQKGNFREDLFYRLYVIPLVLSPLKERKSDIPLLISNFLEKLDLAKGKKAVKISREAMDILVNHTWPGNVRELKNLVERLVVLNETGEIQPADLPKNIWQGRQTLAAPKLMVSDEGIDFNTAVTEYEKALILKALEKTNWVKNKAAELLQIKRTTLVEKIKRYDLKRD
ncbi:MAG: sigma-54 interaction domain-containing protein [Planctomycetota bacterium]|jgi:transcriptional regulator with GAF, ATPase, and Fis domain